MLRLVSRWLGVGGWWLVVGVAGDGDGVGVGVVGGWGSWC